MSMTLEIRAPSLCGDYGLDTVLGSGPKILTLD